MTRSLFSKVFGGYLFIIVALCALILAFSFGTIRDHYLETLASSLKSVSSALKVSVVPFLTKRNLEELNSTIRTVGKETNLRLTVIDTQGVVLADSEENPRSMENHRSRPEIIEALAGRTGQALRYSSTANKEMLYVAIPIEADGKVIGVMRTSLFLSRIESLLYSLKMHILQVAVIIAVISLIAALIFCRSLSSPIRHLMAAARKLASGDFNVRVFLKNKDEIGQLADTFNHAAEQLKTSFGELSRQKEELNSIIVSLKEGLLVLDRRGVILRSNESFRTLATCDNADGKFYWEVLRSPDFTELIDRARKEKRSFTGEVSLDPRIYACSVTLLESGEKIVAVFHDITDIRNLERVKRDFVVNVSHELRTPLTAIKGFVETLDEEVDEHAKRYLDIVKRNTNRLINIVNDLLLLSELEEKGKLELETVDLRNLTGNIMKIFEPRLKEKGLAISSEMSDALPSIKADPFKLEQMFVNLLDNAIKYTEKGEIRVTIGSADGKVTILVTDTGIGIPRQDLGRIFERFYVVDKSRSRKFGGTGLGLSIVKHIVLLHNGTIDVESSSDGGSSFTITLPVDPSQG